jgi:hypothetical protein
LAFKHYKTQLTEAEKDGRPIDEIPVVKDIHEEERRQREETETV